MPDLWICEYGPMKRKIVMVKDKLQKGYRYLLAAPPGIRTTLDLPFITGSGLYARKATAAI